MTKHKWLNLQLFAGEGAGGGTGGQGAAGAEGAATGENAADAGQQALLGLGVPEHLAKKHSAKAAKRAAAAPAKAPVAATEQVATDEKNPTEEPNTDNAPKKPTWKELMDDPDYNREMQATIQARLRSSKGAEENMSKLAPALEVLARKYGQDPANIDYDALAKAINNEDSFYEDKALQMGVSVETAKQMDQQERETARAQRQQQQTLEQQMFQDHIQKLERQGEAMKATFPNFNLKVELQNPAFARMTSPGVGLSVEDAYFAVHRNEIQAAAMQVAAQKTAQKISNSIQAGSRRPQENGASAQAPSVTTFDYRTASKEQRNALKKQIYDAAARGEKVYPGR